MPTCRCIIASRGQQILEAAKYASDIHRKLIYFHNELLRNITNVSPEYKDSIDWQTLLTTQVENLHAVSHSKHETFSALQYAIDFGTISKESLKRMTKWGAKYYTHPSSYYTCLLYTSPSPRDQRGSRMPSSA